MDGADEPAPPRPHRSSALQFFFWGAGTYLALTVVLAYRVYERARHHMMYVLDDAAIHMVIARNLALHGTWGVNPGHFQSASSSPAWTLALAALDRITLSGATWFPLLLNVVASIVVIAIIAKYQDFLRPTWRRPLDVFAVIIIVNVVLFLPALTMIGMEHVAHAAVVLAVMALVVPGLATTRWRTVFACSLLALGSFIRFETIFLALGLALGLLALALIERRDNKGTVDLRSVGIRAGALAAAAVAPVAAFGVFNRLMGGGWLPNSVMARSSALNSSNFAFSHIVHNLVKDRLFLAVVLLALCMTVIGLRRRASYCVGAMGILVASLMQSTVARVGEFARYESYLVIASVLVALWFVADVVPTLWLSGARRPALLALAVVILVAISWQRVELTTKVQMSAADVYDQKFLASDMMEHLAPNQPIASGELGWLSWVHKGPMVDLLGLGDYQVLQELRRHNGVPPASFYEQLVRTRHVRVVVMYPETTGFSTPTSWIYVGAWVLERPHVTAFDRRFQFWATVPSEVAPLKDALVAFQGNLPPDERLVLNPFANIAPKKK